MMIELKDTKIGRGSIVEGFECGHDCSGKGEAPKCRWVWYQYLGEVK